MQRSHTAETAHGTVPRAVTTVVERKFITKMDAYEGERACPNLGRNPRMSKKEEEKREMRKMAEMGGKIAFYRVFCTVGAWAPDFGRLGAHMAEHTAYRAPGRPCGREEEKK